jgi:sulfur transfer complex TusBCD TusB component (DsrH family)
MENNSIVKSKIDYNQFVELVIQHNKSITWQ